MTMRNTLLLVSVLSILLPLLLAAPTPLPIPKPAPAPSLPLLSLLDPLINTTITVTTLNSPPPALLMSPIHSQECIAINQGALMCCPAIFDGDQPIVVMAAKMFDFDLNVNSINGFDCKSLRDGGYCPVLEHRLCCQVTDLTVLPLISLAMWCHDAK